MKKILLISLGAVLISCSGAQNKSEHKAAPQTDIEKTAGLFKPATLPFDVDTNLLFQLDRSDSLSGFEIRTLAQKWFSHELVTGKEYELATFFKIDSLKEIGKYSAYCDSLDIGMTKNSTAHAIAEIQLDQNTLALIWGLFSSSYEACPFATTRTVYVTLVYKGNVGETFLLGEFATYADPPVAMERTIKGKLLSDGTITLEVFQTNDQDMDEPELLATHEAYSFGIREGALKILSEKKDTPAKIKRPKAES